MTRPASFPSRLLFAATVALALCGAACESAPGAGEAHLGGDVTGDADAGRTDAAGDAAEAAPKRAPGDVFAEWLNGVRAGLDLPPVEGSVALTGAAGAHAAFLVRHGEIYTRDGTSAHAQPEGLDGYTGATFTERLDHFGYEGKALAEVIAFKPSALAAGRSWLESLYHRLPLLEPAAREIGYGEASGDGRWSNVLEIGTPGADPAARARLVAWPPPGADDVPPSWDGAEIPQPRAPPAGYPSGPVVTLQAGGGRLEIDIATVAPHGDGVPVPLTLLTADDDPAVPRHAAAVIPHRPLSPETTYRVTLTGTLDGDPLQESWSFTTRAEGCDTALQDCSDGRGCYPLGAGPTCLWSGAGTTGDTCSHVNECEAGLTCVGSRCLTICQGKAQGGPKSCEQQCEHDWLGLTDGGPDAACLPRSCALDPDRCGPAEGCYWVGAFVCDWAGAAAAGDACQFSNDCAAGLGCLGVDGAYACRVLCDGPGLPGCDDTCLEGDQPLDPESGVRFCL